MSDFAQFTYDLDRGSDGERRFILRHLEEIAATRPSTMDEQRQGIDCWMLNRYGEMSVQIKTDTEAAKTGNAFIEVAHIYSELFIETGWLQRCDADRLAYFHPSELNPDAFLWLNPENVRRAARRWLEDPRRYRMAGRANRRYTTYGLLVPLVELRRLTEPFPE